MIRLSDMALPPQTESELAELQSIVDGCSTYAEQSIKAKDLFAAKNIKGNRTFDVVKTHLDRMCSGACRCGYCEDSCADEVEHIWPKNLYPDRAFLWANYLYACGPCNSPKGQKFVIYRERDGRRVDVTPGHRRPRLTPPPSGSPLLIDPRHDDPFDYLKLDLSSFRFFPIHARQSRTWQREMYTIEVLHLNDRDRLIRSRRGAYFAYAGILGDYIRRRDAGETRNALYEISTSIHSQPHITVWREMQRQWRLIQRLRELFTLAPEALEW